MSDETKMTDMTRRGVVYSLPDTESVSITRGIEYKKTETDKQTLDIYYPLDLTHGSKKPSVIYINGYPDSVIQNTFGCKYNDMGHFISWGKLAAVSGMAAITYTTGNEPASDIFTLLQYIRQNASTLGIDENRVGLWACSGHVPNALSVLMKEDQNLPKCVVLCYGYMLDSEKSSYVADMAKNAGFVNPCVGKSVTHISRDIPILIVRAGQDEMPHLNETIDMFLSDADGE